MSTELTKRDWQNDDVLLREQEQALEALKAENEWLLAEVEKLLEELEGMEQKE